MIYMATYIFNVYVQCTLNIYFQYINIYSIYVFNIYSLYIQYILYVFDIEYIVPFYRYMYSHYICVYIYKKYKYTAK